MTVLAYAAIITAIAARPALPDLARPQEAPDVVQTVQRPTVHVRRIRLCARRQGLRQGKRLITEAPKAPSGMSKTQTSGSE